MIARSAVIRRSLEKTIPPLAALAARALPRFVYAYRSDRPDVLPVFVYHVVDASFEADLAYLERSGYRTAGAEELAAYGRGEVKPDGRTVALTFDDGDESLSRVAVPLLERYAYRGIAFVVTELVPDAATRELAGWAELRAAVSRGVLDVGSHSCYHHHVPVSNKVVGFVDSETDTRFTANIPVPRVRGDAVPAVGTPIFLGRPRYTATTAFHPDADAIERCRRFVLELGEDVLWSPSGLSDLARLAPRSGSRETPEAADAAVVEDIRASLARLATKCPNPAAQHLCFPWYARTTRADALAQQAGATLLLGGYSPARLGGQAPRLQRLSQDLMRRLPGPDRRSLMAVLRRRTQVGPVRHLWPGQRRATGATA
ncbi:MAG TPA: polysaccharide deacetylase family protein [Gemmatimonadales bacterium]|nr:polysaccharide deacetylase family protein [Gemmatimonadales bacterium]